MVSELIAKYIWLIRTLTSCGERGLTFNELSAKYSGAFGGEYSRRTFNNHREAVADVFGIDIECDRRNNTYRIPYIDDVLDKDDSVSWLVNTFTVNSLLSLGKERLSGRVSVEEIPSGQKYLAAIMQAMEDGDELVITYAKYSSPSGETLHIQPLAVKEHEKRWYIVAFCHERAGGEDNSDRSGWRVYALDRVVSLQPTDTPFRMPEGFDVDEVFHQSYGIYLPEADQKPVTVRFKTTEAEANYLRDLPLHHSQKEEGVAEDGRKVFSIRVIPNKNLAMEFCRHAGKLEVVEPESVRENVRAMLEAGFLQYSKKV